MQANRIVRWVFVSSSCLIGGLVGAGAAGDSAPSDNPHAQIALQQLQSDFHGASTLGDYELMRGLWTDDAVFNGPTGPVVGPDAIASFFAAGPRWGRSASLAPTYKTWFEVHGNQAVGQFECVILAVDGTSPLTTPFSSIPFGSQNPDVEIVQHSTASVTAVKHRGRWLLQTFAGSAGPMR